MVARADLTVAIAAGRDRLLAAARTAGADAAVPSCRRWTVRDLVTHVGNVHDWASLVVRTGVEQPQEFDVPPAGIGSGFESLLDWYAARADALLATLAEAADGDPCWTFGPPGTVAFWPRRQAHEVAMHAVDAALAAGTPVADALNGLPSALAADGVDEVLTVMMPRVAMFVPWEPLPASVRLAATDVDHEWVIEPDGRIGSAATESVRSATLAGSASALFGLLWRRARLAAHGEALGVEVDGDPGVVEALFAARLTP